MEPNSMESKIIGCSEMMQDRWSEHPRERSQNNFMIQPNDVKQLMSEHAVDNLALASASLVAFWVTNHHFHT